MAVLGEDIAYLQQLLQRLGLQHEMDACIWEDAMEEPPTVRVYACACVLCVCFVRVFVCFWLR